jgi:hypothetical protein
MFSKRKLRVMRLQGEADRAEAMKVLKETYRLEKNWVTDEEKMFSAADLEDENVSWFLAFSGDEPVGVVRILYNPPLELYAQYGFERVGEGEGIDVEAFIRDNRIAEIGRFAVIPDHRKNILVAGILMRAASHETVARGYSHYITDVFEGEKHSPLEFHTRVMGFQPVATHDTGELNCTNRRITMILDLKASYRKLRDTKKWMYRYITRGWEKELHDRMAA